MEPKLSNLVLKSVKFGPKLDPESKKLEVENQRAQGAEKSVFGRLPDGFWDLGAPGREVGVRVTRAKIDPRLHQIEVLESKK